MYNVFIYGADKADIITVVTIRALSFQHACIRAQKMFAALELPYEVRII